MKCVTIINDTDIYSGFSFRDKIMGVSYDFLSLNQRLGNQLESPVQIGTAQIDAKTPFFYVTTPSEVNFVVREAFPARLLNSSNIVDLIKPPESKKKTPEKTLLVYWAMWQKSETYGIVTDQTREKLAYHQVSLSGDWFEILFTLKTGAVATIYFENYAINLSNNRGVPVLGRLFPKIYP